MAISDHPQTFAGLPIEDFKPSIGIVAGAMPRREYHFSEGTSNKFWAISLDGKDHTVEYGKIGTAGQTQKKSFKNEEEARKAYVKLVAEKTEKGYKPAESMTSEPAIPAKKAKKSAPGPVTSPRVFRLSLSCDESEEGKSFVDLMGAFLDQPGLDQVVGLVIGAWHYESMMEEGGAAEIVETLVAGRKKLPNLKAIFFGDVTYSECEISWIRQTDVSPLWSAFPELEQFRVRGGVGLTLGKFNHKHLKTLIVEAGGLPVEVVREVGKAKIPALEHLELWLGVPEYGGNATVDDLKPILIGKGFPELKHLGLRNSEMSDDIAAAVASAPILDRIKILDLSLGTLSDKGAESLLSSPGIAKLEQLDLHHHYLTTATIKKLKALKIKLDVSDQKTPDDWGDGELHRSVSVSE